MEALNRKDFLRLVGLSSLGVMASGNTASAISSFASNSGSLASQPLRVAHLTDVHVQSGPEAEKGFASCLNAVNTLPIKPEFIINGGDAIMNSLLTSRSTVQKQWDLFHSILKNENDLPALHCIGNHDLCGHSLARHSEHGGKEHAVEEYQIPKRYYSRQKGSWKFIVLDSIQSKRSVPGYYACLDEEQMHWLRSELQTIPANMFICIVSHVPILAICTLFDNTLKLNDRKIPDNILHADASELTGLFFQYPNVKACLSGHIHMIDHVNYLGVDYYCNGAVSGSWWKGKYHEFPPSFSVMNFYDNGKVTRDVHYYNWDQSAPLTSVN